MKNNLKNTLWETLLEQQLIPEYDNYINSISKINKHGYELWANMQKAGTGKNLRRLLNSGLELKETDIARILGFGAAITQYLIAPVPLPQKYIGDVIYCGAKTNLLVTLFDYFADNKKIKNLILIDSILKGNNSFQHKLKFTFNYLKCNSFQRLIGRFIIDYFEQIKSLSSSADPDLAHKRKALNYVISRMYEAEKKTLSQPEKISSLEWRHKSAFPFLAMGLPAWFPVSMDKELWIWHLRRMYSFGYLIGLIDDAVDFENDCKTNSPNIFRILHPNSEIDQKTAKYYSVKIANRIISVQNQFKQFIKPNDLELNQLPIVLICSWYGGVRWDPTQTGNN